MASTRPLKKLLPGSKEWGTEWHDSPRLICCCICCSAAVHARGHVGLRVAWSHVPASTTVPRNKPSQRALAPPGRGTCCRPRPCPWEQSPEDRSHGSPSPPPPRGRRQADGPCPEVAHHLERDPRSFTDTVTEVGLRYRGRKERGASFPGEGAPEACPKRGSGKPYPKREAKDSGSSAGMLTKGVCPPQWGLSCFLPAQHLLNTLPVLSVALLSRIKKTVPAPFAPMV